VPIRLPSRLPRNGEIALAIRVRRNGEKRHYAAIVSECINGKSPQTFRNQAGDFGRISWQKQRLKPESERLPGASFVRGYGPVGQYSMYLPSPVTEKKIIFRDGKPSAEFAGSCLDIPEIRAARDKVLECAAKRMPFAELLADLVLVEYSVVLLRTQYNLTDPDLEMLHSGKRWHQPLIVHAMGGKDVVDSLRRIDPQRISEIISDAENRLHGYAVLAGNPPNRPSLWKPKLPRS
jgi:hypothetical protein